MKYIKNDPHYRECPSASCDYGYIHTTREDGNIFRCEKCSCRYCIICEVTMYESETCDEYQSRIKGVSENEKASEDYLKKKAKQCPECTVQIKKAGGCDHMTCKSVFGSGVENSSIDNHRRTVPAPILLEMLRSVQRS